MLTKLIVNNYRGFFELILWLTLLGCIIGGWQLGISESPFVGMSSDELVSELAGSNEVLSSEKIVSGLIGSFVGLFAWWVISTIFVGVFLILDDIGATLERIETSINVNNYYQSLQEGESQ